MMRSFDSDLTSPKHRSVANHPATDRGKTDAAHFPPTRWNSPGSPELSSSVLQSQVDQSDGETPHETTAKWDVADVTGDRAGHLTSNGSARPIMPVPSHQPVEVDSTVPADQPGNDQWGSQQAHDQSAGNGGNASDSQDFSEAEAETGEPERGLLPVLRNRNFLTLWGGQVFSQLADKVYLVLMIALIASRFQTQGQTISGWVSSLMIAFTIPAVLFGSVAGVFVDHWRKRAVLVTTNLLRGGLVLGLPVLLWVFHAWKPIAGMPIGFLIVLSITFLVSTLTQFFAPAEQAVIPLIVERKHLLSANSLYTMTMMASVIVGFALGEPLLALADQVFAPVVQQLHIAPDMGKELVVGGSYVIAGLLLMSLKTQERTVSHHEELPDVWKNIQEGVRYLSQQGQVRAALICQVILFSIFAALAVLAVRLAEVMPEIKSSQFGFLLAAGGVGMAIGAVLVGQFGQRFSRAQLSLYGSIGIAASLAAISFSTQHLFPTLPLLTLLGAFAAIAGVPMQTAIQEETPEAMRGKVFGLQNNAINIALSLPLALAGIAETWFGLQAVFLSLSVLAIAGGILTWSVSRGHNPVK